MTPTSLSKNEDPQLAVLRGALARRHHLFGWICLLIFLSLGGVLEALHAFKIGAYLDLAHKVRREMWTLAHAHGTLLALVHVGFAAGVSTIGQWTGARLKLASFLLLDAAVLIPLGFFLGGIGHSEGDPSAAILLVPLGALALFVGVGLIIHSAWRKDSG
jgi:hypothetical protein